MAHATAMKKQNNRAIGAAIQALRKEHGLSQAEFSLRCGFTQSKVSKLELGEQQLSMVEGFRISQALGIAPKRLFDRVYTEFVSHGLDPLD